MNSDVQLQILEYLKKRDVEALNKILKLNVLIRPSTLLEAAATDNLEIFKLIKQKVNNSDINYKNEYGWTCLMIASFLGNLFNLF
jgi:ankyrin repeat protein